MNKTIRFEVFKRDGFKCAYCGRTPPDVMLEVDHIEPKSKGGKDDINNYITACFDCNRGKKHIPLSKIPPKIKENLEILQEKEKQIKEYRRFIERIEKRINIDIETINHIFREYYPEWEFSDQFKRATLKIFINKLPIHEIQDSLILAISKFPKNKDRATLYFCGICWRKIKNEDNSYGK